MTRWLTEGLPRLVARVPTTVHKKLLAAFLVIVLLLITVGGMGLLVLNHSNRRAKELVELQRKIAAYRQLQHDTTAQLYSVASALLIPEDRTLDATLRQLNQFGYDLDRLQFVAKDEVELLGQVRKDYDQFIQVVSHAVELIRSGKIAEGRQLQLTQANALAERLERLMNQLVNRAEADMVASIEASDAAYTHSRWIVIGFALGSIALALILGYAISWSVIGPVQQMDIRFQQIASGDFSQSVEVPNRDELGTLAANLNRMSEELGRLYKQIEDRNRQLTASLEQQTATSEVLRVISSSPTDLNPVYEAILSNVTRLCEANIAALFLYDGQVLTTTASYGTTEAFADHLRQSHPRPSHETTTRLAALERRTVHVADLLSDPAFSPKPLELYQKENVRTVLSVPMLRENALVGVITTWRREVRPFTEKQIALVKTFADQAVIAIENVRLFHEIEETNRQLEVANRHKSEFLSRISHDLRTPLNSIIGFTRLVLRKTEQLPELQRQNLQKVLISAEHLLNLINGLLDLAKIEAGRMEVFAESFRLDEVIHMVTSTVEPMLKDGKVRLVREVAPDMPPVYTDREKLKQIILNLLSNAAKFTEQGEVRISASQQNGSFKLTVSDTGIGMDKEALVHIFDEFRQAEKSTASKYGGTGLGLAIVKRLVNLLGGDISVESQVGLGSSFTITLPITLRSQ
ncbi:MAG: GAF domain-containing protein [Deltaproteobacteria bacterium]|nr:GAF domain-containing protein [Deltaproteobacteria bacterium]